MTEAEVLALINSFIVDNGNNEITANVLRPILVAMLEQPNDKVGELSTLSTTDKSNIVNAINEVLNEANSGFKIHAGTADPNVTPPATYAIGDWYIRNGVSLYQYNGSTWVLLSDSSQDFPTHYKGNFDATTISPALSNVTGVVGDEYKVINGGVNVDFGAGNVFLETDDIIIFYDSQWRVKVSPGIPKSEKGAIDGVATLDANGKLTASELPDLAITDVIVAVETTIALFAANSGSYVFQQGDVIILDNGNGGFYIYKGGTKTDVASYSEISASEVDWSQVVNTPTTIGGYGITDFNSLGDARWLLLSSYTAADVLAKILTVDGSGSGLDADLLRGVHWGNVNTDIKTTGKIEVTGSGAPTAIPLLNLKDPVSGEQLNFERGTGKVRVVQVNNLDNLLFYNGDASVTILTLIGASGNIEVAGTASAAPATLSTELVTKGQLDAAIPSVSNTFTPTLIDAGGGATYSGSGNGNYMKIGDFVFFNASFTSISTSGTPSGELRFGLSGIGLGIDNVATITCRMTNNNVVGITTTGLDFIFFKVAGGATNSNIGSVTFTSPASIYVSGFYKTND